MKKMNKEKKCLLITSIFIVALFAVFIPIGATCDLWGLTVGWAIGGVITLASQALLFASGHAITETAKNNGKGTALTVLFYLSRFALFAVGLVICGLFQWVFPHHLFTWSIFTCVGSVLPSTLIITIFYNDSEE